MSVLFSRRVNVSYYFFPKYSKTDCHYSKLFCLLTNILARKMSELDFIINYCYLLNYQGSTSWYLHLGMVTEKPCNL